MLSERNNIASKTFISQTSTIQIQIFDKVNPIISGSTPISLLLHHTLSYKVYTGLIDLPGLDLNLEQSFDYQSLRVGFSLQINELEGFYSD